MKRFITLLGLCISLVFQSYAQESSLLWKVSSPDGAKASYLFGTYHLIGSDYLKQHQKVDAAYNQASNIVVEVVMDSSALMQATMKSMMLGKSLKELMDSNEYALVKAELEPVIGMPLAQLDQFKPSAISAIYAVIMAQKSTPEELTFKGDPIDVFFAKNGKKENKSVTALETVLEQADILYGSQTLEEQADALVELVEEKEEAEKMTQLIVQAYIDEDLNAMWKESMRMEDAYGDMEELVDNRNIKWISKLTPLLEEGQTFIAVGALHLPGENGLIELLKKEGYTLTPVL
jgi:uncharacterized protein YbaP (TraB family)